MNERYRVLANKTGDTVGEHIIVDTQEGDKEVARFCPTEEAQANAHAAAMNDSEGTVVACIQEFWHSGNQERQRQSMAEEIVMLRQSVKQFQQEAQAHAAREVELLRQMSSKA